MLSFRIRWFIDCENGLCGFGTFQGVLPLDNVVDRIEVELPPRYLPRHAHEWLIDMKITSRMELNLHVSIDAKKYIVERERIHLIIGSRRR